MAAFIKSIDPHHMLITGEEGYRSQGPQLTENNGRHDWINNGLKGVEFKDNTAVSNIDAATVHAYPDNWGFTSSNYRNYGRLFMQDRAKIARDLNKPIIMEEYGMNQGWLPSRNTLLNYLQEEAKQAGFACALVWQVNALAKDGNWGYK
jgi:mannan endo-1,4-beta-mannosidase